MYISRTLKNTLKFWTHTDDCDMFSYFESALVKGCAS